MHKQKKDKEYDWIPVCIVLDKEINRKMREMAYKREISKSQIAREAIKEYLRKIERGMS